MEAVRMYAGKLFGYARCSTIQQHEDRQINSLREFGVLENNIVVEKMSGKNFERPLYRKLIEGLKPEDTLVIASIDRMGRSYNEVIDQWRYITKVVGAAIVVLDMPVLNTQRNELNLTDSFVADLVLAILSYMSEMERSFNRQRQAEGIIAAKVRGVKFGRKPKNRSSLYEVLRNLWYQKKISAREAGRQLGISHTTFLVWVRKG